MKKKFYVIGMQVEIIHTMLPGEDCRSADVDGTNEVYHLYLMEPETKAIHDFTFWAEEGWCGSGYTTAGWGMCDINACKNNRIASIFNYAYSKSDKTVYLDLDSDGRLISESSEFDGGDVTRVYDSTEKPIINVNYDGGDGYYPCGGYYIEEGYFRRIRGKSYLASKLALDDDDVFDTDEKSITEDTVITATYIVIGQKSPYSIEDVASHIFDRENVDVVAVNMSQI